jgi:hypothetical protein
VPLASDKKNSGKNAVKFHRALADGCRWQVPKKIPKKLNAWGSQIQPIIFKKKYVKNKINFGDRNADFYTLNEY